MARQALAQHADLIGTYSNREPNPLDGKDAEYVKKTPVTDIVGTRSNRIAE
jgi:hypothetical protein